MNEAESNSTPTGTTVDGVDYLRVGVLTWGPVAATPTVWECQRCHALALSTRDHSAWHRDLTA